MQMNFYITLWLIGLFVHVGLLFPDTQNVVFEKRFAYARRDMGTSVFFGAFFALIPVLGTFTVLCITGFGEHGFYFTPRKDKTL